MGFLYRPIEPGQECEPLWRNPRQHHAPVLGSPAARDQTALVQTVEQPSDVGIPCNHAVTDFAASESFGRAAQDPEHVILRRREVFGLQRLRRPPRQHVGRTQQVEKRRLFGAGNPPRLAFRRARFSHLLPMLYVITNSVKTTTLTPARAPAASEKNRRTRSHVV